jgi:hypothetical protein
MSLPSSVDPGITRLLDALSIGATASDSTAALLLRLVNRVTTLEAKSRDHDVKLDKLSKQPRLPVLGEKCSTTMTGVEGRNGAAVGPERDSALPRPAPRPGRKDSPPRKRLVIGTGGVTASTMSAPTPRRYSTLTGTGELPVRHPRRSPRSRALLPGATQVPADPRRAKSRRTDQCPRHNAHATSATITVQIPRPTAGYGSSSTHNRQKPAGGALTASTECKSC